ncbi:retrotransposon-related protein [Tanacetum coccineum]
MVSNYNKGGGNVTRNVTTMPNNTPMPNRPYKKLTQQELEDKRAKHLCFYCDQKYTPGHKCSGQLYSLEVIGEGLDVEEDGDMQLTEEGVMNTYTTSLIDEPPLISLSALTGENSYRTMRVRAYVRKNVIHTLVDCGSTHNFLDWNTARKLGCKLRKICPLEVSVANGLVMSRCEMVLGIQWLATLGWIRCDFKNLVMEYTYNNKKVVLRGTQQATLQWMQGKQRQGKKLVKAELSAMSVCVCPTSFMQMEARSSNSQGVEVVLRGFELVFDVPKDLPPKRTHDHRIPLVPNTSPVNVRPYKHPPSQKDAIELMVKELLESGVIRNSQSPFSSPIAMVKKKDGTWRMCVDYRQLNKATVKDKFPIPVVEELIDELSGSKFFSKLIRLSSDKKMEEVFKEFLRKFVLVFFDDILIYSKSLESHLDHLKQVLTVMKANSLFAKRSKCVFATTNVEYLGHIISGDGVATDPSKVQAMKEWPVPKNIKQLRGFLGLTEAQSAFEELKEAMAQAPVLALPDFNKTFIVETDASGCGIGAVLQQEGHPIAFHSKTLAPKHQSLSTYEKEFLAVLMALKKWRGYLLDRHFKIKTDHFSLKYLMGQRLTTPFQTKWLPKLLGFDYEISYKSGSENVVADALSRILSGAELNELVLTSVTTYLMQQVKNSWTQDEKQVITQLQNKTYKKDKYEQVDGVLRRRGKIVVGNDSKLRAFIIHHYHGDAMGGHSGASVTLHRIKEVFYWKGLLQPLPIPEKIWSSISMDFIKQLPNSHGKTVILVVVDRLSKYAHFMAMQHPFTASTVAQVFLDNVYRLHGMPDSIISDKVKIFLSHFWQSLFKVLKVQLKMSTAYHPHVQTEIVNKCLECFLRCMTGERPKEWTLWLPMAEFCGDSLVESVDRTMQAREDRDYCRQGGIRYKCVCVCLHLKRLRDECVKQTWDWSDRVLEVGCGITSNVKEDGNAVKVNKDGIVYFSTTTTTGTRITRIVLRVAGTYEYLYKPLPEEPLETAAENIKAAWKTEYKIHSDVACLMLGKMSTACYPKGSLIKLSSSANPCLMNTKKMFESFQL